MSSKVGIAMCLGLLGCAAQVPRHEATRPRKAGSAGRAGVAVETSSAAPASDSEQLASEERQVGVEGIEGTLSHFDVRVTLERKEKSFAACHEPRARSVPALAGKIEFNIHVLRSGEVGGVLVRASDLGDRVLERCLSEVIESARFPAPHGGEADVTWTMLLGPARPGHALEQWEGARIKRVVRKRRGELLSACSVPRSTSYTVTAYVSRTGRVLAAGVAAADARAAERFDCIADALRSWTMPKPRKAIAKVSFPLRSGA